MLMPGVFGESLFDDLVDSMAMPTVSRGSYNGSAIHNAMRTDVKEIGDDYELDIELPGFKKENVNIQLKDGYLTIDASNTADNKENSNDGKYVRRERFCGSVSRSFYVGEDLSQDNIHAKFEDGVLKLTFPREQPRKVEEKKFIPIE